MSDDEEELQRAALPYTLPTYNKWDLHATFYHPLMAGSIDGTDVVPHDRAVLRAMRSKYKPNKRVSFLHLLIICYVLAIVPALHSRIC